MHMVQQRMTQMTLKPLVTFHSLHINHGFELLSLLISSAWISDSFITLSAHFFPFKIKVLFPVEAFHDVILEINKSQSSSPLQAAGIFLNPHPAHQAQGPPEGLRVRPEPVWRTNWLHSSHSCAYAQIHFAWPQACWFVQCRDRWILVLQCRDSIH